MLTTAWLSRRLAKQKARQSSALSELGELGELGASALVDKVVAEEADGAADDFVPLSAEQAQELRVRLRQTDPVVSPWRVIAGQALIGALLAVVAWVMTGKSSVAMSVAYGALAVVVPAALFARGLMSQFSSMNAITAGFGFFIWEMIKIAVSIVLIAMAPKLVADLDWLAMLIGLIVTMKAVWLVLWLGRKKAVKVE